MTADYQLNAIATRSLVDPDFCDAILNGHRREHLQEFNLSEEVSDAIMCIDGDNIHNFIHQLYLMMVSSAGTSSVRITSQNLVHKYFESSQTQNLAVPA